MQRLDDVSAIELGYPHDVFARTAFMHNYVDGGHDLEQIQFSPDHIRRRRSSFRIRLR